MLRDIHNQQSENKKSKKLNSLVGSAVFERIYNNKSYINRLENVFSYHTKMIKPPLNYGKFFKKKEKLQEDFCNIPERSHTVLRTLSGNISAIRNQSLETKEVFEPTFRDNKLKSSIDSRNGRRKSSIGIDTDEVYNSISVGRGENESGRNLRSPSKELVNAALVERWIRKKEAHFQGRPHPIFTNTHSHCKKKPELKNRPKTNQERTRIKDKISLSVNTSLEYDSRKFHLYSSTGTTPINVSQRNSYTSQTPGTTSNGNSPLRSRGFTSFYTEKRGNYKNAINNVEDKLKIEYNLDKQKILGRLTNYVQRAQVMHSINKKLLTNNKSSENSGTGNHKNNKEFNRKNLYIAKNASLRLNSTELSYSKETEPEKESTPQRERLQEKKFSPSRQPGMEESFVYEKVHKSPTSKPSRVHCNFPETDSTLEKKMAVYFTRPVHLCYSPVREDMKMRNSKNFIKKQDKVFETQEYTMTTQQDSLKTGNTETAEFGI